MSGEPVANLILADVRARLAPILARQAGASTADSHERGVGELVRVQVVGDGPDDDGPDAFGARAYALELDVEIEIASKDAGYEAAKRIAASIETILLAEDGERELGSGSYRCERAVAEEMEEAPDAHTDIVRLTVPLSCLYRLPSEAGVIDRYRLL